MQGKRREPKTVDRREFTVEAALALLSGVAITISACDSGGPEYPTAVASPTPEPTANPSPTPTATPEPDPDPYGEPTPRPNPTPEPTPAPTPAPTPTPASDKVGSISSNHGHGARITAAQLTSGGALSLNIQGSAGHPHTVQLSAGEVSAIAGNQQVSKTSSSNSGHDHTVTFN
jgi:outer membrane biosynthesis protein TonB